MFLRNDTSSQTHVPENSMQHEGRLWGGGEAGNSSLFEPLPAALHRCLESTNYAPQHNVDEYGPVQGTIGTDLIGNRALIPLKGGDFEGEEAGRGCGADGRGQGPAPRSSINM